MNTFAPVRTPVHLPQWQPASGPAPLTLSQLMDAFVARYEGRDNGLHYRLQVWRAKLGHRIVSEITDDDVHAVLQAIKSEPSRSYAGKDVDGRPIFRNRGKRSPATVNRYLVNLSAVFTFAKRQRLVPKGWTHPCRGLQLETEPPGKVRFLESAERSRLLAACKASSWPKLYLLVLMAITTGARRGELLGLTWRDIDVDRAVASVARSKNGEAKTLPLTPAVVDELARHRRGADEHLVFASRLRPDRPYCFETAWRPALKAAAVERFRFHDLRHSFASYLAQSGATLIEIADAMGHKQFAMTKRYAHLTTKHKAAMVNRVMGEIR
jgi:integrase